MNPEAPGGNDGSQYGGGAGLAGAIIQVGGALYDSWRNRKAARENTDKTIAANKAEAELAYQRSIQQWHMQNAYNTPEAQMQRFMQAGLNPHLIYGQGNSGSASSPVPYQPANMQYRYEAPQYGAAFQSILPLLMSVGTWMQNMRATEVSIDQKLAGTDRTVTDTERLRQLIDYLAQRNPQMLQDAGNKLSLYPYQRSIMESSMGKAHTELQNMQQEYRHKFGEELFARLTGSEKQPAYGGIRRLEFLQEASKARIKTYEEKLAEAKSSWSEFDITDPQALMQLVLNGVMGLAGQTLRLSTHRKSSPKPRPQPQRYNSNEFWRNVGKDR